MRTNSNHAGSFQALSSQVLCNTLIWAMLSVWIASSVCPGQEPAKAPVMEPLLLRGHYFELEPALDNETRQRGLMYREDLRPDRGMIFVFDKTENRSFWMANCLMDIDIMFLDAEGRITALHTMLKEPLRGASETQEQYEARLKRYPSKKPAQFAIEVQAGMLSQLGVEVGEQIPIDAERLVMLLKEHGEGEAQ